jgi:hypothetical protein
MLLDAQQSGRLGDMHINEDGSKTMGDRDQKIIHRWNHESDPYTGIRRKCFTLRKNQFSLLVKCRNNTGIGVFAKQCFGGVFGNLVFANG